MEPGVTYAELRFPQTPAPPARKGQAAVVRTTVTTSGKAAVSSPVSTKLVRTLAILSFILLVLVVTLLILAMRWSSQLQRRTAEVMQCSANATLLSEEVMYFSKLWDTSQQNLTQLLSEYAAMTSLYQNLSVSFQNTNNTLQDLLEQQRQAAEHRTQMWSWLQGRNVFQCSREDVSGHAAIRCKSCQEEWTFQNPHCYYFSEEKLSWWNSRGRCASHKSKLVSVNSREEQIFINSRLQNPHDKFWIGYSDSQKEGQWHWEDGSSGSLGFWNRYQPDNYNDAEDCVTTVQYGSPYSWNDDQCWKGFRYICEKDADQVLFNSTSIFS
ncbi:hypothetical protein NDU88_005078 [Pleurodeles waltl]|uniref:C-type lectin domain-containing protein n=1 Tax=Pleurodeles waltl TaxID=8319 RepID=A0AAV7L3B7_PLEWA|nr:hypothetical protein NDU88_005078 [Pleurodeles waltl]